jgi:phage tail sheath gpL-like
MIPFNRTPSNLRVPFVSAEFDNSRAQQGPALMAYRGLIVGQKLAGGTAAADSLQKVTNADQVAGFAGRGSMLHRQAMAWFAGNKFTEVYVGVLADNAGGIAAAGSINFTSPATADGDVMLYVGGELVQVPVASGDTANAIAAAVAAAMPVDSDLPVTAAVDGVTPSKVNITFRHKGLVGNELDLRLNYQDGDALPAGVTAVITPMAGGTLAPSLTNLISAMGDIWFNIIAHPYTDAASLTALETELEDRFGPMRMIDGVVFTAKQDTHANLATLGESRNSQHNSIVAANKSPTPPFEYAAHVAAVVAYFANIDPARPLQTLPLSWVKAPAEADLFTLQERNLLLYDGISTTKVVAGQVQIERLITTYQKNSTGAQDTSYLNVETMLTLMYARFAWRNRVQTRYPRHKVANDGTRFGSGQPVVTPKIMKGEAISWFRDMEELGLFENFDQFKQDLVVERNAQDPNRLDVLLPPDLINQLIVTATNIQFRV